MTSEASILALGLTHSLRQLIQGVLSPSAERMERETDHSLTSVPRFRISGTLPPHSVMPLWYAEGQFYLSFTRPYAWRKITVTRNLRPGVKSENSGMRSKSVKHYQNLQT